MVINKRKLKIGAIIQARTASTRLPNKILFHLPYNSNLTIIENIVNRAQKSVLVDKVIVATTNLKSDDVVGKLCEPRKICCFRGDEKDVLSRYFEAAKKYALDVIVRLTGDNPCIDFELMDKVIRQHVENDNDYTRSVLYPIGTNVEVLSFKALKRIFLNANQKYEREYVTLFILNNPDKFKMEEIETPSKYQNLDLRLTVDNLEDYALMCCIFDELAINDKSFNLDDIVLLFRLKPWLKLINKNIFQKKIFIHETDELTEAIKVLNLQELYRSANVLKTNFKKISNKS